MCHHLLRRQHDRSRCKGYGVTPFAPGHDDDLEGEHRLWYHGGFLWCARCGGFARTNARLLKAPCRGHSLTSGKLAIKFLWSGVSPYHPHPRLPNGPAYRVFSVEAALRADNAAGVLLADGEGDNTPSTQIDEAFTTIGERRGVLHDRIQERTLA